MNFTSQSTVKSLLKERYVVARASRLKHQSDKDNSAPVLQTLNQNEQKDKHSTLLKDINRNNTINKDVGFKSIHNNGSSIKFKNKTDEQNNLLQKCSQNHYLQQKGLSLQIRSYIHTNLLKPPIKDDQAKSYPLKKSVKKRGMVSENIANNPANNVDYSMLRKYPLKPWRNTRKHCQSTSGFKYGKIVSKPATRRRPNLLQEKQLESVDLSAVRNYPLEPPSWLKKNEQNGFVRQRGRSEFDKIVAATEEKGKLLRAEQLNHHPSWLMDDEDPIGPDPPTHNYQAKSNPLLKTSEENRGTWNVETPADGNQHPANGFYSSMLRADLLNHHPRQEMDDEEPIDPDPPTSNKSEVQLLDHPPYLSSTSSLPPSNDAFEYVTNPLTQRCPSPEIVWNYKTSFNTTRNKLLPSQELVAQKQILPSQNCGCSPVIPRTRLKRQVCPPQQFEWNPVISYKKPQMQLFSSPEISNLSLSTVASPAGDSTCSSSSGYTVAEETYKLTIYSHPQYIKGFASDFLQGFLGN